MAFASFAVLSNMAVANERSCAGNHAPTAFALAGKVGASPTPSNSRAAKNNNTLGANAAASEAMPQTKMDISETLRTPNVSSNMPVGNWQAA